MIRASLLSLACLISTVFSTSVMAQPSTRQIQSIVNNALHDSPQPVFAGIVVQSMKTGKILYQRDASHHFLPASTLKLVTAIAALEYLKPHFRYKTEVVTNNKRMQNNTLQGNVWFRFSGDPSLRRKHITHMLEQLKEKGVRRINGHVYVDISAYDTVQYPPGWIWDDFSYAYAAPTSPLVLNQNRFLLTLKPAKGKSHKVTLSAKHLPANVVHFDNQLRATTNTKDCPIAIYSEGHNRYRLKGCVQKNIAVQRRLLAITDPVLFGRQWIKHELNRLHIAYRGRITVATAPKNSATLLTHRSKPLSQLAITMLKDSDNLIADAFFKTLGQHYFKTAGSWQNGVKAVEAILGPLAHINFKNTLITDGAGLSRYNLITPMQLAKLLHYAYHDMRIEPELLAAMPIAGKDGTLTYRMRHLKPPRNVRGKTGSMGGVSGLAGYLTTTHKDVLSYVILINNFVGKVKTYRNIEDQICVALTGQRMPRMRS